jgi:hypothetical protein
MSLFQKLRGTLETIFQIGLAGPQLKNNAGIVEARNAADNAYAIVRGAAPVGDSDLVTKLYLKSIETPVVVTAQFDGNNALPSNTGVEHYYVVTTTGANATIGDVVYDNGSSTGTAVLLSAHEGRIIFTSQAFSGGTITFAANSLYAWDTSTSQWLQEGSGQATSGSLRVIRMAISTGATQSSASSIPANAVIFSASVEITTPYSGGTTISVGRTGSTSLLQATTDNLATTANTYQVTQETAWGGSDLPTLVTVAGAPSAGAGFVTIQYALPDA